MSYIYKLVISIDQLYNTICGGDPDITISARVGYFSRHMDWKARPELKKFYWQKIEELIDWAYEYTDGKGHCRQAYEAYRYEDFTSNNKWPYLIIMSLIIVSICFVVGGILHLLKELGFKKFNKGKALQLNNNISGNLKTHLRKGIKKILRIIMALIILPIFIVIMALLLIPIFILLDVVLIFLIIMALALVPISILLAAIFYFVRKLGIIRFNKRNASQSKYKITVKVKTRLMKGIKKFKNVLKASKDMGISKSDTVKIIMDMLHEIFGYHKYSEITSNYDIKKTPCVLTVKIDNKREFLIEVYPIEVRVCENGPKKGVYRVILTNGIDWKVFKINKKHKINRKQVPEKLFEFDFLSLDPKNPEHIDKLYNLSKESLCKSVNKDHGAEAEIW